jgi:hypothetical protein
MKNSRALNCGLLLFGLAIAGMGCATHKPLPFAFSPATPLNANGPILTVRPVQDDRGVKDNMDKTLALPTCLDPVLVTELERSGLFSRVELSTNSQPAAGYVLQGKLNRLQWEVPGYDRILVTIGIVSFLTGGVGGVIYGSTPADVLGHATVHFTLTDAEGKRILLDREYVATETRSRAKLASDLPSTYRERAATAFKSVLEQFKEDLRHQNLN